ncbi:5-formyltetrahydrofolate cyclo-ligase [Geobacter argillaceus]|uniref:5-formyltetrahydrofolate cyclo-ligase n=2 Tax=Geobacter argillaceus TaxID=345631 RepID=A0A562V6M9_9BACT|nr:5-formyltetrahydrofolate cyclo-ligase [Geobacter argillaceus]
MLARRRGMSVTECSRLSDLIQKAVISSAQFVAARSLALYAACDNEVATSEICRAALAAGKELCYPRVEAGSLVFREASGECELVCGSFGIPEPQEGFPPRDPGELDLIVIPGVAFDLKGHRIGYGKGFYDRTVHLLEGSGRLVGLCYDFQLVDAVAGEPHDVLMDLIITESRQVGRGSLSI